MIILLIQVPISLRSSLQMLLQPQPPVKSCFSDCQSPKALEDLRSPDSPPGSGGGTGRSCRPHGFPAALGSVLQPSQSSWRSLLCALLSPNLVRRASTGLGVSAGHRELWWPPCVCHRLPAPGTGIRLAPAAPALRLGRLVSPQRRGRPGAGTCPNTSAGL